MNSTRILRRALPTAAVVLASMVGISQNIRAAEQEQAAGKPAADPVAVQQVTPQQFPRLPDGRLTRRFSVEQLKAAAARNRALRAEVAARKLQGGQLAGGLQALGKGEARLEAPTEAMILAATPPPVLVTDANGQLVPDYFGFTPNWAYSPPLRKFVDTLPGLGPTAANNLGQFIPIAVPDVVTYPGSEYYEIELRQYSEKMHSDMAPTLLRGYIQVNSGTDTAACGAAGQPVCSADHNTVPPGPIHFLGPMIIATKDRPVRIKFVNKLGTGAQGNLFIPVDTSIMGAGEGPVAGENYTENRATLHLHGGKTVWISDGTPHQWITPATEQTSYPKGVSVSNVPDMPDPGDGSQTFFYSNQQSARLMFYHDHAYGITRLNVYAGEAAAYMITDDVEKGLVASGLVPASQIPLVIQDKTFVDALTILETDPTWQWGSTPGTPHAGDLWWPHVYMPAQNPYHPDFSGVNAMGRWAYGPWFWPPTTGIAHPPVANPYYDPINRPWEAPLMPGTPNPSWGAEAFMDTPIVNGTAYPSLTVQPKAYRLRILNAAHDRFFNLSLFVAADKTRPTTPGLPGTVLCNSPAVPIANCTEVRMLDAAANPTFPPTWPADGREGGVPDPLTAGPNWVQIGTEGGFLPAPVVIPPHPVTWNTDPTTFNAGNVNGGSLILAPAERADVVVDFSAFRGKTLILYNDSPAPFPALDPHYDYYTGAPDRTEMGGAAGTLPGYGPNTRTIMQIVVADAAPAAVYETGPLEAAFRSTAADPGVFARGQAPVPVGQTAYNSAYNTVFPATWPNWGVSRIFDTSLGFRTTAGADMSLPMQMKAIQDEMGEVFDDYGRMSAKLGLTVPIGKGFVLQNFVDPPTEIIADSVNVGPPVPGDGTQIWKITHNGVDTHPVHFHLFDVQVINRVGWDGFIRLPDPNELGWKDTVRISPLEDTIVALRPTAPKLPFGVPESVRPLNPTVPLGSDMGFSGFDPFTGERLLATNTMFNFGWEYVWHCHILSHEEQDMMRPIKFNVSTQVPNALSLAGQPVGSGVQLSWTDPTPGYLLSTLGNPSNEIGFRIERDPGTGTFAPIGAALANTTSFTDAAHTSGRYRVVAFSASGETASNVVEVLDTPSTPANLQAAIVGGTAIRLTWTDTSDDETQFVVARSVDGGTFATLVTIPRSTTDTAATGGVVTFDDMSGLVVGNTYAYYVVAENAAGASPPSNQASVVFAPPPILTLTPAQLTFATQAPGTYSAAQAVTIQNTGFAVLNISNITLSGTDADQFLVTSTCGATLAIAASCIANVRFAPGTAGVKAASLDVNVEAPAISSGVALSGTAVGSTAVGRLRLGPPVVRNQGPNTVVQTALFPIDANTLLVAFISADASATGTNVFVTAVTNPAGGALTWTRAARANVQRGTAEIWWAFALTARTVRVRAALSQSVSSSLTVVPILGADTTLNGAGAVGAVSTANAASGTPTGTLLTTRANSFVFAVGIDWDSPRVMVPASNQVIVNQYTPTVGDTYWTQRTATAVAAAGPVTIGATYAGAMTDRWNLALVEIREAIP